MAAASRLAAFWNHPAGPKTNFSKPPEKLSMPQQSAVTATGLIWMRYSTVIIPKNWNLFSVNTAMAATGLYQLARRAKYELAKRDANSAQAA
eukprot:jgi/Chlat1/7115/Chrsp57S06796